MNSNCQFQSKCVGKCYQTLRGGGYIGNTLSNSQCDTLRNRMRAALRQTIKKPHSAAFQWALFLLFLLPRGHQGFA